jgi:TetR/AcrR family transcriptional regulator, transcriptional repressor for nem operon
MGRTSDARERLIASAIYLIGARSYRAVSVDDLCAHAGVNKGSFYHFFPAKRDLALAAIDRQGEQARRRLFDPAFAPDVPPLERIARLFAQEAALQKAGQIAVGCVLGCPFGNLAVEMGTQDAAIRAKVDEVLAGFCAYVEDALREAQATGSIRATDVAATARATIAYFEGVMLLAKAHNDAALIERLGTEAIRLVGA